MATIKVRLSALPAHVRTARLIAGALARRSGLDDGMLDEVRLAVGEACLRAVSLHQQTAPAEPILLTISDGDGFVVTVIDCVGPPARQAGTGAPWPELVDPVALSSPEGDPTDLLPSGFGLAFIAGLVDEMTVTAADRPDGAIGTAVCMSWPSLGNVPTGDEASAR